MINPDGTSAGYSLSRKDVHSQGLWHRTVHVWILNSFSELLIQKRSLQKEVHPGLWDISCAGHLSSGDDSIGGAIRELNEELGLIVKPTELQFLFTVTQHYTSTDHLFVDNELTDVFLLKKDLVVESLQIDHTEVAEVKMISIGDLKKMVEEKSLLLAPHDEEFNLLFELLSV